MRFVERKRVVSRSDKYPTKVNCWANCLVTITFMVSSATIHVAYGNLTDNSDNEDNENDKDDSEPFDRRSVLAFGYSFFKSGQILRNCPNRVGGLGGS